MPLAYYSRAASQEFWAEHWAGEDVRALVEIARASPLTEIIEGALPPAGLMLEAGCGLGQYVALLRERGRAIAGVDWSVDALRRGRADAPGTPLAAMDLAALGIRSGALHAYLSLGVVEHDPNGPAAIVAEAARVLAPGGRLLLSVPYWNGVRRIGTPHVRRRARRLRDSGGQFYQFAFSRREVRGFLEAQGFRVLAFRPYDPARIPRKFLQRLTGRGRARSAASPGVDADMESTGAGAAAPCETTSPPATGARRRAEGHANASSLGDQRPVGISTVADGLARSALKRLAYSEPSLRLFAHMLLAVAVRA